MPSLWLRFDKDDDEIMGGDLPDMISFTAAQVEAALLANGHKRVDDMIGYTEEEHACLNEATPPEFQEPWTPEKFLWFPAKEGFAMCKTVREAMIRTPKTFADYPGMIDHLFENIAEIETVLQRAWLRDARFNLVLDT